MNKILCYLMHLEKTYDTKVVDEGKKSVVAIIQLKRTIDRGTVLFVKSPMFETFFKSNNNNVVDETVNSNGDEISIRKNFVPRNSVYARNFDECRNTLLNSNGDFSLGFLRCDGISEGIEFSINGLNSKEALEQYKEYANRIIPQFYNDFMKTANVHTKIQVIEDVD